MRLFDDQDTHLEFITKICGKNVWVLSQVSYWPLSKFNLYYIQVLSIDKNTDECVILYCPAEDYDLEGEINLDAVLNEPIVINLYNIDVCDPITMLTTEDLIDHVYEVFDEVYE